MMIDQTHGRENLSTFRRQAALSSISMSPATQEGRAAPVIVVSGLPRSGTSLAMQMLEAAGIEIVTDGRRTPGEDNPGDISKTSA